MWSKEVWYKYWYIYTTCFISAIVFFPAKIYGFDISMYFTIISAFCNLSCNCITQWTYKHNSCLLKHCISLKVKGLLCHYNCWFIVKCDWVHLFNLPQTRTVSLAWIVWGHTKHVSSCESTSNWRFWNEADLLRDALCLFCGVCDLSWEKPASLPFLCAEGDAYVLVAVIRRRSSLSHGWRK